MEWYRNSCWGSCSYYRGYCCERRSQLLDDNVLQLNQEGIQTRFHGSLCSFLPMDDSTSSCTWAIMNVSYWYYWYQWYTGAADRLSIWYCTRCSILFVYATANKENFLLHIIISENEDQPSIFAFWRAWNNLWRIRYAIAEASQHTQH